MSETPRIEFPFFATALDPMLAGWVRFQQSVAGAVDDAGTAGGERAARTSGPGESVGAGVWRLLASNNREIARSVRVYPSFDEARSHALTLRENADELVVVPARGPARGMRGWYLCLEGIPVMTCSRWYEASASSADASVDAINSFKLSTVAEVARPAAPLGRRGGRAPQLAPIPLTQVRAWR